MTIAQLYQHLQTTDFQAFKRLRSAERINLIHQNTVVHISSKTEAEEYAFCMHYIPVEILAQANHSWALEMSYAGRVPANHPMVAYLSSQLSNGYRRAETKDRVKMALTALPTRIDEFLNTPLRETICRLASEISSARREAGLAEQRAFNERELARSLAQLAQQPAPAAASETAPNPVPPALPQMTFEQAHAEHQANIERAITLSLQTPMTQQPERIPFKDVAAFCRANRVFRWKMYDPTTNSNVITYVDSEKARKIREILDAEPEPQQTGCNTCMSAEGVFGCGIGECAFRMCGNCFFAWHLKKPTCPGCRGEYIPISTRPTPVPIVAPVAANAVAEASEENSNDEE